MPGERFRGWAIGALVPKLIADAGESAALRYLDFFTANIRNPNTRAAYAVAERAFFAWLDTKGVAPLAAVRTHRVSAYVEGLTRTYHAPTVKQHLAAIRMLFDWLIVGQVAALTLLRVRFETDSMMPLHRSFSRRRRSALSSSSRAICACNNCQTKYFVRSLLFRGV